MRSSRRTTKRVSRRGTKRGTRQGIRRGTKRGTRQGIRQGIRRGTRRVSRRRTKRVSKRRTRKGSRKTKQKGGACGIKSNNYKSPFYHTGLIETEEDNKNYSKIIKDKVNKLLGNNSYLIRLNLNYCLVISVKHHDGVLKHYEVQEGNNITQTEMINKNLGDIVKKFNNNVPLTPVDRKQN
jgi:hypothetical protein